MVGKVVVWFLSRDVLSDVVVGLPNSYNQINKLRLYEKSTSHLYIRA